jgi:hypothetical protein
MNEWCEQRDIVYDADKIYRCSACGRRLSPQKYGYLEFIFKLPPHKKKGYKIRRKKGHNKRKSN